MALKDSKRPSRKHLQARVSHHGDWVVYEGHLVPAPGRPRLVSRLFTVIAEKIPFECLSDLKGDMRKKGLKRSGIYLAHDSMGAVRYAGRGDIFSRLAARWKAQPLELRYFSFYVIESKNHEREVETLVIRATSHMLDFNERKKRSSIEAGSVRDYEPGTRFYERQYKRGRKSRGTSRSVKA